MKNTGAKSTRRRLLALLLCIFGLAGCKSYYSPSAIEVVQLQSDSGGLMTLDFRAMPETLYACSAVEVESTPEHIELRFVREHIDAAEGVVESVSFRNEAAVPVILTDKKGNMRRIWP